uniref:HTH luxR-type domain-containing protein n=1 Tax=Prevotella sp. GTC17260 TaxID=3236796 RepID=A0AB33J6P4_9BACT
MNFPNIRKSARAFLQLRAADPISRHQVIVYLLHTAIVVIVITMQLTGLGGSQKVLPKAMSMIHLSACLTALSLFLARKVSVTVAFSSVALVAQATIVCRFIYFSHVRPEQYLHFIVLNQITSLMAVVFLVMCFVKYTPFVVATVSLITYGSVATYLKEPTLWNFFGFFLSIQTFLCVLGELLRRNVLNVQTENSNLHHRETRLMRAVRLNGREMEGYLRMSSNDNPTADDADRLFAMLTPKSQRNLINAVRLHLRRHLTDDCDLARLFPMLTKSEVDVCNLILQDKKMNEIGQLLEKSEKNVGVVRAHIRKKLDVPQGYELKQFLTEKLEDEKTGSIISRVTHKHSKIRSNK